MLQCSSVNKKPLTPILFIFCRCKGSGKIFSILKLLTISNFILFKMIISNFVHFFSNFFLHGRPYIF